MKTVSTGQSIFDLAIITYGSVEGIFFLIADNGLSGIDMVVNPGTALEYDKTVNVISKEPVVKFTPPDPKTKAVAQHGQSIFDIAINNSGNIESIFDLLKDNGINSLDTDLVVGAELKINPGQTAEPVFRYIPANFQDVTEFVVTDGQTLFDVALQLAGSMEGLFDLLEKNNMDLDTFLEAGQVVEHEKIKVVNKSITNYYTGRGMRVNSGSELAGDFWITESDEFVSDENDNYTIV